jgi:phage gp46-like protein
MINLRANEGCAAQPNLLWDTVWDPAAGLGDWAVAGASETLNRGGLQATRALETAVILCLFTDRFCPPDHPLAKFADDDRRGWWGDGIDVRADLGETPLGSLLWLLERAIVDDNMARWAESLALDALSPLIAQGAAARATAQAEAHVTRNRMDLSVQLYGRDGTKIYDRRFDDIWRQEFALGSSSVAIAEQEELSVQTAIGAGLVSAGTVGTGVAL